MLSLKWKSWPSVVAEEGGKESFPGKVMSTGRVGGPRGHRGAGVEESFIGLKAGNSRPHNCQFQKALVISNPMRRIQ